MEHVVIVGAGHGGAQAAASLREEGYEGRITLVSDERVPPYHRPPLSKAFLKDPAARPQFLRGPSFYKDHAIELLLERRASALDLSAGRVLLGDGAKLDYSHLVLALGGRSRRLAVPGADFEGVHSLLSLADAEGLRARLSQAGEAVVVGGGFIGMEVAATLAQLGMKTTVIEAMPRVLGRAVAPLISDHMHVRHQGWGVEIITGDGLGAIEGAAGRATGVVTSSGRRLPTSLVVVGVGMIPNVALAEEAGLAADNGVVVDEFLRTSDPNVFAIGDCASYPHWAARRRLRLESVQNATDQGRTVAKAIVGRGEPYRAAPWFWSDQQHIKLQMVGLSFEADDYVVSGDRDADRFSVFHFSGGRLLAIDSINNAGEHMLGRRMLAAGFSPTKDEARGGVGALKRAFMPAATA
jgi:3-phenylpropionate/trans-cinnamate dioxygenase ferredoxin reductase component